MICILKRYRELQVCINEMFNVRIVEDEFSGIEEMELVFRYGLNGYTLPFCKKYAKNHLLKRNELRSLKKKRSEIDISKMVLYGARPRMRETTKPLISSKGVI